MNENIPSWLTTSQEYKAKKDSSSFVDSTKKATIKLLSNIKQRDTNMAKEANTSCRLFSILLLIILTAVSRNFSFVIFMVALTLLRIASLKANKIRQLLRILSPALIISFLILLPSIFLGNPKTPALVLSKILVCTSLVMILNLTAPWNEIIRSLKLVHIPDIVIFTFDLTMKYIYILGEICSEMLSALSIRQIGKNKDKKSSMSGVLGTVFVRAKKASDDTTKAMECRGFNGKYVVRKVKKINEFDILYLVMIFAIICVFVYLEVIA